ncbi:glycosyltransferase [Serratia fonticola]|uniref:glycosyltransferase n=1 Tax=Serratia fonticola TaxID=47917 RepID=UPI0034C5D7FA
MLKENIEPTVNVILPVYNAEEYLSSCLESLVSQTYENFTISIIDDGSTDNSLKIIKSFAERYDFISYSSRGNKGLVFTLNELIAHSMSKYIIRMDADDICERTRLELQVGFLHRNQNIAAIGSNIEFIDEQGGTIGRRVLPKRKNIYAYFTIGNPFCHPSMAFNSEIIGNDLHYNDNWKNIEDFALWLELSKKGYVLDNLQNNLLKYRLTKTGITSNNNSSQKESEYRLISEFFNDKRCDIYIESLKRYRENKNPINYIAVIVNYFIFIAFDKKIGFLNFIYIFPRLMKMLLGKRTRD